MDELFKKKFPKRTGLLCFWGLFSKKSKKFPKPQNPKTPKPQKPKK
jgi:hypothetical protein